MNNEILEPIEVGKWFKVECECSCVITGYVYADNEEQARENVNLIDMDYNVHDIRIENVIDIEEDE